MGDLGVYFVIEFVWCWYWIDGGVGGFVLFEGWI